MLPTDRGEITNFGALNLPRSTPSVDLPEQRQPAVRRYSRTRAQTMEGTECYLGACSTTGGFLKRMSCQKDD